MSTNKYKAVGGNEASPGEFKNETKPFTYTGEPQIVRHGGSGLRKIADIKQPCMSPEHNPPMHISLPPGLYEYICPSCGHRVEFTVPMITYSTNTAPTISMKSE